ncbi:ABC transporter permease [Falsirhodobacter algicola]|uniref:ABC transporter permease subunit n=1 Tax=Falsirhodobacter algicola TaxID=2692330 RepID=A0A8J8SLQ6_9RHOB|nr:ABC transporter permease [Falsirhodobacter algicola]QUS37300.1 ABC transporter permease subunit [Falsirhodobacter algicola]
MTRPPLTLIVGGTITAALVLAALIGRVWTPADPAAMNILARLRPPGDGGLLGTDAFGRDVASLLMAGAWTSLGIAGAAVLLGGAAGVAAGTLAAARGGRIGAAVMAACGVLFAFPPILSAVLLGAALGPGAVTAIAAIALFMVPVFARISRGAALQIWTRDFVLAARMAGKGRTRITLDHVLPNIAPQIVVQIAIQMGLAILAEAGLGFLGMSVAPPLPSWGRMLADSQTWLAAAPHLVLAPGGAIALAVLGLNLLGDGLRTLADPRRRGR